MLIFANSNSPEMGRGLYSKTLETFDSTGSLKRCAGREAIRAHLFQQQKRFVAKPLQVLRRKAWAQRLEGLCPSLAEFVEFRKLTPGYFRQDEALPQARLLFRQPSALVRVQRTAPSLLEP